MRVEAGEEAGKSAWASAAEGLECHCKKLPFHSVGNRVTGVAGSWGYVCGLVGRGWQEEGTSVKVGTPNQADER